MRNTYQKNDRLRISKDYSELRRMGCKYTTPHFVLFIKINVLKRPRIGITVSRKVGNAVVRNRIKRYIKEFFRNNKNVFNNSDYSIIARYNTGTLRSTDINKELTDFLKRMEN